MTESDLTNLIIGLEYEHSKLCKEVTTKMRLGLQYNPEHILIVNQLTAILEILQGYVLVGDEDDNPNYFNSTEMIELLNYTNSLLRTIYQADFVLN